jgi:hypothetical protein
LATVAAYADELRLWFDELKASQEAKDEVMRNTKRVLNIELAPPGVTHRDLGTLSKEEGASAARLYSPSSS